MTAFTDRVALVTGGAGGIGRDVALAFGEAGGSVVVADIDGDGAGETADRVSAETPGEATAVETDVTDEDSVFGPDPEIPDPADESRQSSNS